MILVWTLAVPLAGVIAAGLVVLLRRHPAPASTRYRAVVGWDVEPEPIADPLHPGWRPIGELVAPLYAEQMLEPAPWSWPSFTQAWPILQGDSGE